MGNGTYSADYQSEILSDVVFSLSQKLRRD